MYITLNELTDYLHTLVDGNYHGKINIGLYGGKVTSVKLDASIDLEALKKAEVDDGEE